MIAPLAGREGGLEQFGWTGREAEWIALACLHSGVFVRTQWSRFLNTHPERAWPSKRPSRTSGASVEPAGSSAGGSTGRSTPKASATAGSSRHGQGVPMVMRNLQEAGGNSRPGDG